MHSVSVYYVAQAKLVGTALLIVVIIALSGPKKRYPPRTSRHPKNGKTPFLYVKRNSNINTRPIPKS